MKPAGKKKTSQKAKRRVAAYARVSTDSEEQQTSYDAQVDQYTKMIKERDDWSFAGVYTDEGITGTSTKHREGFNAMVSDALDGKIDLIITKSVSRFARNTVDSLTTIRKLKDRGIEIYFEKEEIWTLDSKGELLITLMSSLAQEESRSISENVKWGHRKRFSDGKVSVAYSNFLGYDKGPDGKLVVNKEQAAIVERIFSDFLSGYSYAGIARRLMEDGIKSPMGKDKWGIGTIKRILTNEKYKGDALLGKTYTPDFLTKKQVPNNGEYPQYYVADDHEPIIAKDVFDRVQGEVERRAEGKLRGISLFSTKICCGECGCWYGSKVWHSNDKYRSVVWQCNGKYKNAKKCETPALTEAEIEEAFVRAANKVLLNKTETLSVLETVLDEVMKSADEEGSVKEELTSELKRIRDLMNKGFTEDPERTPSQNKEMSLGEREDTLQNEVMEQIVKCRDAESRRDAVKEYIESIRDVEHPVAEFDKALWTTWVDKVTVFTKGDIHFTLADGTEISA